MKLCLSGEGQYFILNEILVGLKLNFQQFQNMCILARCDYLHNVKGVGVCRAYDMIVSSDNLFDQLKKKGASSDYEEHFHQTKAVFTHQTICDVETLKTVPLQIWESNTDVSVETKMLCGRYPLFHTHFAMCTCCLFGLNLD